MNDTKSEPEFLRDVALLTNAVLEARSPLEEAIEAVKAGDSAVKKSAVAVDEIAKAYLIGKAQGSYALAYEKAAEARKKFEAIKPGFPQHLEEARRQDATSDYKWTSNVEGMIARCQEAIALSYSVQGGSKVYHVHAIFSGKLQEDSRKSLEDSVGFFNKAYQSFKQLKQESGEEAAKVWHGAKERHLPTLFNDWGYAYLALGNDAYRRSGEIIHKAAVLGSVDHKEALMARELTASALQQFNLLNDLAATATEEGIRATVVPQQFRPLLKERILQLTRNIARSA